MKNALLLFVVFAVALGCKKEEPANYTPEEPQALWVKFDAEEQPFKTTTIYNPEPTVTSSGGEHIIYRFDYNNDGFRDIEIVVLNNDMNSSADYDSLFYVGIDVSEAIVWRQKDGLRVIGKYIRNGDTIIDSVYALTFESPIISPFTDTVVVENTYGDDSRFFSNSTSINLLDTTLIWANRADRNAILNSGFSDFYVHRNHYVKNYSGGPYGSLYQVTNDFHKGIIGQSNKIFVFRWRNNNSATGYYYGWMELSLTENREFTIHKVVYQVD